MDKKPSKTPDNREIINFFQEMLTIRRFEEKAGQLYGMGYIGGFCHLSGFFGRYPRIHTGDSFFKTAATLRKSEVASPFTPGTSRAGLSSR